MSLLLCVVLFCKFSAVANEKMVKLTWLLATSNVTVTAIISGINNMSQYT